MKVILVVAALVACVACSSSQQSVVSLVPGSSCPAELEGKFVGGADGALLGARFVGKVLRRFPSGKLKPARRVSFIVNNPYNDHQPRNISLGWKGRFSEPYDLSTDTHYFCVDGKVIEEEAYEKLSITVASEGCLPATVEFTHPSKPIQIVLACTE